MAWITDSLSTALAAVGRLNPFGRAPTSVMGAFSHQLALAAYMSSGMMRKVISIPAADRTQKWRDWQAEKDDIALIEAEEKRLGLRAKVKQAEVLRGVGGGALLLITAGDHATPLDPATLAQGGLVAINVLSRWQMQGTDWVTDLASPDYGCPRMFEISGDGRQQRIHPSRVICFRGDPVPMGAAVGHEDAFWGDCRLLRVFTEVQRSDKAAAWFADLVRKAKLLRFGVSGLDAYDQEDLNKRVALIATGEDSLSATIYSLPSKDGAGGTVGGEQIDDYQVNWSGIPAMMDAFDQRVAAVADIPFTRLMGRSPAGMNATGKSDQDNYWTMVSDGQENETRPCLEALDTALLRSAGVTADDVTWRWAPLWTPTEQEEATAFKTFMEAFEKLQASATIPDRPYAEAMQNWMEEREYMPGLGAALAKLSEDERFGLSPDDDGTDPSAITQSGSGVEGGDRTSRQAPGDPMEAEARRRAANDKVTTGERA